MKTNEDAQAALESFEEVAMPHMNDLFRAASSMLGSRTEAEDIVQETYLQAWKSFHRFTPGTNCRAWLFKILFHVVQHHRRKWFKFKIVKEEEENLEATLVYEPPVPQDLSDEDVLAAFRQIPQAYREVVLLSDVYDFTYKEIHETLDIPIGTVMSRLSRGRQLLRAELSDFAGTAAPQSMTALAG
ncbi:MAG TPA: sigma-70 family RNA polymerase sigma factor [Blastocatellia bacterium]|jgi:RNA polymerase sigma-70 factor (ECF subfamily)